MASKMRRVADVVEWSGGQVQDEQSRGKGWGRQRRRMKDER